MSKNVLVGLSGGVDSAVAAALLQKEGWDVHAVFVLFSKEQSDNSRKSLNDAKQICEKLGILLHVEDASNFFEEKVVSYFLKEYVSGKTPNPCIYCNEKVKFKVLLDLAKKLNMDYVATGHYAKIVKSNIAGRVGYELFEGNDESKDQSYFLYRLKQKNLKKIIFPLGEYRKDEVRSMAKSLDLPVHAKAESQNICFLGDNSTEDYFATRLKLKKGKITDMEGNIVGEHNGLPLYTIGQRKGINIGGDGPYFVVAKNKKNNTLLVTNNPKDSRLNVREIGLKNLSWPNGMPDLPFEANVRIRYRNSPNSAMIKRGKNGCGFIVEFKKAQRFVAAGQSAVFYSDHGEVLGGGIIK